MKNNNILIKFVLISSIFLISLQLNAKISSSDCGSAASQQMAIIEADFGCLDAESYNAGYYYLYVSCLFENARW